MVVVVLYQGLYSEAFKVPEHRQRFISHLPAGQNTNTAIVYWAAAFIEP